MADPDPLAVVPSKAQIVGWVQQAQGGSQPAFERLHEVYGRVVYGVLLARVPPAEADDLVQDVLLRAWQQLPRLRDARAFGPWICRIARNRANDWHRRRRPAAALIETSVSMPPRAEALEALAAIRTLPECYREPLVLRLVEGLSGPEIAERTGLTAGSVRVNLHRGMARLRAALGHEETR